MDVECFISLSKESVNSEIRSKIGPIAQAGKSSDVLQYASAFLAPNWPGNAKEALTAIVRVIIECMPHNKLEEVACEITEKIKSHHHRSPFDEADYLLRECLFSLMCGQERFHEAATVLSQVNIDSQTYPMSQEDRADLWIKCAEACLEDDASVDAEVMANKASALMNAIDNRALMLRYKVSHARVLDSNRKFIDAALKYHDVSKVQDSDVDSGDLLGLLGMSVTCAVLGKAGPQRSRVMGMLYRDERLSQLDSIPDMVGRADVLRKMYIMQLLETKELQCFEEGLKPHQRATTSDGLSVVQKAVMV